MKQKISPFLWFGGQAEQAAEFYTAIFKNSRINSKSHYGEGMPVPAGTVMTVSFELDGVQFTALNGPPGQTKFNESISFVVACDSQEEIDRYWDGLIGQGGAPVQCGWLKDQYGVSWQVVPSNIGQLAKSPQAMKLMMGMVKLDKGALEKAAGL